MSDENIITESFRIFQAEFRPYLQNCWDRVSSPFPESDLKTACYAAIFNAPKRKREILYVGRVTKRFLFEENGSVDCLELDCLKPASRPSFTRLEKAQEHFGKDVSVFRAYNVIAGSLKIVYVEVKKWKFYGYFDLFRYLKTVEREDRKSIFE